MANTLSNAGIVDGQIIYAVQVNQIIDALTSADDYDISISGSLELTGSLSWSGSTDAAGNEIQFVVRDTASGELYTTGSSAFDFKLSGSFPAERLVITENTSSANAGGLATSNNLRTYNDNNGIVIGGSEGSNGVVGLGLIISEDSGNGNHTIVSDGSGSNLNIRAAGGDEGDRYVVILSDQAGSSVSDVFEIAKFGGPLRGAELYHTGSLVLNTTEIGANKAVVVTGTISASAEAYLSGLANTTTPHIVGFDTSSGKLSYYSTASFGGGGSTDTGSLMVTGSVTGNVLTFTKGDSSTFNLTVDTGSAASIDTGSFYISSSVSDATITFTQGDGSTFPLTINNVNNAISASFASTASYVLNAVSASYAPNLYNSDDTLTGTRTVNLSTNDLIFNNSSARFIVSGSNRVFFNNLDEQNLGYIVTYDPTDNLGIQGVIKYISTSSLSVASASYAPNIYNSDGELTDNRVVNLGGNNLTFIADQAESFIINSDPTSDVTITDLATGSQSQVIGYNSSTGQLTAMDTSSLGGTVDTGSLLVTGSVSNATLTFTKGDGSTFPLTVNNVANATTAGSVSSDSVYSEAADFDVWTTAGNTFTLLDLGGTNIQVVAPKNVDGADKLLAVTTMEVYRSSSNNDYTTFEYRLYNSTQAATIPGSTRNFLSDLLGTGEGAIPTTFTFTLPISSDVSSGDVVELQVRQTQGVALTYLSASISYADLSLVSITT